MEQDGYTVSTIAIEQAVSRKITNFRQIIGQKYEEEQHMG